ncbi:hypothetical protein [Salinispora arenicola]|uniref:hypothetical protein n=1 Tax=Salinispora arenicola TaxID=168697 RepID=UPI00169C7D56|nr:hypothetical protein [Salinispora arenicola]NIL56709.1 hypothetical protein [Salinispora arenicola]NIL64305.1 hypothetical protein [Salinispora arenicola]
MQPQQPRKRTNPFLVVAVVLGGVVALCLGIGVVGSLLSDDEAPPVATTQQATPQTPTDPSKLDEAGNFACTDFAKGYKAAQTRQARADLADTVNKWASSSGTDRIADAASKLGRTAESSTDAWTLAADSFAVACTDAGWSADTAE